MDGVQVVVGVDGWIDLGESDVERERERERGGGGGTALCLSDCLTVCLDVWMA